MKINYQKKRDEQSRIAAYRSTIHSIVITGRTIIQFDKQNYETKLQRLAKKKKKIRKIERIVVTLGITQARMIPLPEIVIFQSLFS